MGNRINLIPSWFKPAMYGNYDLGNDTPNSGKVIGHCQLPDSLSWEQIKAKGVTHAYSRQGFSRSDIYDTFKYYNPITTSQAAYNAGRGIVESGQFNASSVFTEELSEDGTLHFNNYWQLAPHWYKGMTDAMGNGAVKNRIYGGYSGGQNDVSAQSFYSDFGGNPNPLFHAFRDGLDDMSSARKLWEPNNQVLIQMPFFNNVDGITMSSIMGLMTSAYSGFMKNGLQGGAFCYSKFYEVQKKYAAGVRNTVMFGWTGSEGPGEAFQSPNFLSGWKVRRDDIEQGAYFRAQAHHNNVPYVSFWIALLGVFMTDGIVYWDSYRDFYGKNPVNLVPSGYFQRYWQSQNASEPPVVNPPFMSNFPWWQQDYSIIALQAYNQVKQVLESGGEMRYFDYSTQDGNVSVNTSKTSDKRLFTESVKPYGQNNILHLANNKKGLCFGAYSGNQHFIIYFNPYYPSKYSETVSVNVNGQTVSIGDVKGKEIAIYKSW